MKTTFTAIILLALLAIPSGASAAGEGGLMVAVAANFTTAMEKISAAFYKESGSKVRPVYSSTGKLYAQIKNSAPFDLFLAADAERPELLAGAGLCEEPFIYATGAVVLWSKDPKLVDGKDWRAAMKGAEAGKIAISSPEIAPYGKAAMTALETEGLLDRVEGKLVYGQNVAQAFQYAYHGSADLAFTALSFALSEYGQEGGYLPVPEAPGVVQKGCVVKSSENRKQVEDFLEFLRTEEVRKILKDFGYR